MSSEGLRKSQRSTQGDGGEVHGRGEWLELGDKIKGTVHTGVVAGNRDEDNDERERYKEERAGIFVITTTSTETVVNEGDLEGNWLNYAELSRGGSGCRKVFDDRR